LKRQAALFEEPGLLAQLRSRILPVAALTDREFQDVLGHRAGSGEHERGGKEPAERCRELHSVLLPAHVGRILSPQHSPLGITVESRLLCFAPVLREYARSTTVHPSTGRIEQ